MTSETKIRDIERFMKLDIDTCMCCHAKGPDMRNLFISSGSQLNQIVPEMLDMSETTVNIPHSFYLRTCKKCRGRFEIMLAAWFKMCAA